MAFGCYSKGFSSTYIPLTHKNRIFTLAASRQSTGAFSQRVMMIGRHTPPQMK